VSVSAAAAAAVMVAGLAGCEEVELPPAKQEVQETQIKLDLPPVPDFTMPSPNSDGSHPPAEMRLKGNKLLDAEVKVRGYVIWIYDCPTAIQTPDMDAKELARILEEEPERCDRPSIYLGDTAKTSTDRGLWVVEVPRPARKDEEKTLPDELLAEMKAAYEGLPPFKSGDEVIVTGTWALRSPKGFRNSDGLLVYGSMQNLTTPAPEEPSK